MFVLLGNFALVLNVTMTLIYSEKSDKKQTMLAPDRGLVRSQYTSYYALSIISAFAFLALLFLPKYTNAVYYEGEDMDNKETTILMVHIFYYSTSLLYICSFLVSTCCSQ